MQTVLSTNKRIVMGLLAYIAMSKIKDKYRIVWRGFINNLNHGVCFELLVPEHAVQFLIDTMPAVFGLSIVEVTQKEGQPNDMRILLIRIVDNSTFKLREYLTIMSVCEAYSYKLYDWTAFM